MAEDDAALLAAVRDGSARAFNTLVDRHQQPVRAFVRRLTRPADADDIAQETFLAAWMQAGSYKGASGGVRSWLFAIAWRKAKDDHRRRFRLWRRDAAYRETAADDLGATPTEDAIALEQALEELPIDQRAAIVLCLGVGFTHEEAAEVLGLPLGTVKSHVLRGRERLRGILGEQP